MQHYWKGPLDFPEDAGVLITEKVRYDKDSDTLKKISNLEEDEEYLIAGFDSEWLLFNNLQGNRNPIKVESLKFDSVTDSYTIEDIKELVKIKRFDSNTKIHTITSSYRRTTY